MSRHSSFGSMFGAHDASCDNLYPGEDHLVLKPNVCVFRRKCTYLNKSVTDTYYNIHHKIIRDKYGFIVKINPLCPWLLVWLLEWLQNKACSRYYKRNTADRLQSVNVVHAMMTHFHRQFHFSGRKWLTPCFKQAAILPTNLLLKPAQVDLSQLSWFIVFCSVELTHRDKAYQQLSCGRIFTTFGRTVAAPQLPKRGNLWSKRYNLTQVMLTWIQCSSLTLTWAHQLVSWRGFLETICTPWMRNYRRQGHTSPSQSPTINTPRIPYNLEKETQVTKKKKYEEPEYA